VTKVTNTSLSHTTLTISAVLQSPIQLYNFLQVCVFFIPSLFHVTQNRRGKQILFSVIENITDPFLSQKLLVDNFTRVDSISFFCTCCFEIISLHRHSITLVSQYRCSDIIPRGFVEPTGFAV